MLDLRLLNVFVTLKYEWKRGLILLEARGAQQLKYNNIYTRTKNKTDTKKKKLKVHERTKTYKYPKKSHFSTQHVFAELWQAPAMLGTGLRDFCILLFVRQL